MNRSKLSNKDTIDHTSIVLESTWSEKSTYIYLIFLDVVLTFLNNVEI